MTKMLQGVSCHPLTPHLIKLIVTCIRLGKKKGKKSDNKVTFVFHPFFFALFENHDTLHVNTSSLSILLSSVKRIQAQACEIFCLHKVSL